MKTGDVRDRMGVYKRLEDVPPRHRFDRFAGQYEGRDVWQEYWREQVKPIRSEWRDTIVLRAGRSWKEFCEDQGRHHALATPDDVEAWTAYHVDRMNHGNAYQRYWLRVERFYEWLMHHTDHPHHYNPVWMAVAKYPEGASGVVWNEKRKDVEVDQ